MLIGSAYQGSDIFYVSHPDRPADTKYFKELGVNLVVPEKLDATGWFEELSFENVGKYPADIIMMDNRDVGHPARGPGEDQADLKQLPAVKAGQVIPRVTEPIYSYDKCAPILEALAEALENAEEGGLTPMTTTGTAVSVPFRFFPLAVVSTRRLGPSLVRVTFTGAGDEDLEDFASGGRDQSLSLFLPHPGQPEPVLPPVVDGDLYGALGAWRAMPDDVRAVMRSYTVRQQRRDPNEIDIDFAVHEDGGPACRWAQQAAPGDRVAVLGPVVAENTSGCASTCRRTPTRCCSGGTRPRCRPPPPSWSRCPPACGSRRGSTCRTPRTGWSSRPPPTPRSPGS